MYKLVKPIAEGVEASSVQRFSDNAFIPFDPANTDAQNFAKWLQDGNIPEAASVQKTSRDAENRTRRDFLKSPDLRSDQERPARGRGQSASRVQRIYTWLVNGSPVRAAPRRQGIHLEGRGRTRGVPACLDHAEWGSGRMLLQPRFRMHRHR